MLAGLDVCFLLLLGQVLTIHNSSGRGGGAAGAGADGAAAAAAVLAPCYSIISKWRTNSVKLFWWVNRMCFVMISPDISRQFTTVSSTKGGIDWADTFLTPPSPPQINYYLVVALQVIHTISSSGTVKQQITWTDRTSSPEMIVLVKR